MHFQSSELRNLGKNQAFNFFIPLPGIPGSRREFSVKSALTDTGENVQKWTRVFSTRRWLSSEKREENRASTFGQIRLWTSFESSPISVKLHGIYIQPFYHKSFMPLPEGKKINDILYIFFVEITNNYESVKMCQRRRMHLRMTTN